MKWLFRSALTLVTLVLFGVLVLVLVPTERVAGLAAERFEQATGRALTFGGPVKATLWPRLGVRAESIEVANADWSDAGPMLTAETLEVGIALGSILGGDIRIETLEVDGARLTLERRADGTGNWQMDGAEPGTIAASGGGTSRGLSIDRAVLSGAEITWIDRLAGRDLRLRAVDLETRLADMDSPVTVRGSGLIGGQAVTVEASADALRPLLDGALTPMALAVSGGETTLGLDGRADLDPLSFEGRVEAETSDGFTMLRAFGIVPPAFPDGLGAGRVAVTSAVTLAPVGTLHLRDMVADLDRNRVTGALDIDPTGARPRLTGTLAAEALDLTALSRKGQGGESALVSETGWGREVIDVSALFLADGEMTFASGPVTLGDATLDEVRARATIDSGRAVVTLQPLIAYGGTVTGDFVVNGRDGLSARADLELSSLQMQPFLTEFADTDRLIGAADLSLDLLGTGETAQALMDTLRGEVDFRIGQGELLGLDIPGMVWSLDLGYRGEGRKTIFDGMTARFDVTDGVARGDDFNLEAQYLTAEGAGEIDLGAQTLDYRLIPTVRREEDGNGVTVPLLIQGAWSDPRIRPDLEFLARQRVETEREELEARARAEADEARNRTEAAARRRLAEELDVDPDDLGTGREVRDALKDRVEEQLIELLLGR